MFYLYNSQHDIDVDAQVLCMLSSLCGHVFGWVLQGALVQLERWPQPQLTCLRCWVHQAKLIGVVLGSIATRLNSNVWFSAGIL